MKKRFVGWCLVVLTSFSLLNACKRRGNINATQAASSDYQTIEWSDLMPAGAERKLDAEYDAFYEELDQKLAGTAIPLSTLGPGGAIPEGSALDYVPQLGTFDTVPELDGQMVRLPGFIVPLSSTYQGRMTEFLLVPYFGACIHAPPPPPNQIVLVEGDIFFKDNDIWLPHVVEGKLIAEKNYQEIGNAAYRLELDKISRYNGH